MINIAICDDDKVFLHNVGIRINKILKSLKVQASISLYTDARLLIKKLEKYDSYYDIIFLDIDMPAINGKEAARRLRLVNRKFKLIFITSFEQEVLNTFQYENSSVIIIFFILHINYIFIITDIIAGNLLSWIYGTGIEYLILETLSLFVFSKIIAFLLILLYIQVFKKVDFNIPYKYWVIMDSIIGFFIIIINFFIKISSTLQNESPDYSVQIAGVSVYFLLMSALVVYIFGEICLFYQKEQQRYAMDLKNKALEQQLVFQEAASSDLKKIRHDIKNNLANISYLLNENHIEESVKYINAITSTLEVTKSTIHCGNNYLDAILNYELVLCKNYNIDARFVVNDIPELNIEPTDLSSIFSNILNNAVEANLKLTESERYISLKVFCYKNYLTVVVKNPYRNSLIESDGIFTTNKKDKMYHGYGLKSVKSSVERYGGTFKYSYEGNSFTSMIILKVLKQ